MTAAPPHPPFQGEPATPAGRTVEEAGGAINAARVEPEVETSKWRQYADAMRPRQYMSMADGYPVVVKQFIQFCLILIYPGWVFTVLFGGFLTLLFYVTVYPLLWLLFWPVRAHQKKHHPEEYATNRAKYAK